MIYKASLKLTTNFLGGGSRKKGMSVRPLIYTEEGLVAINEEEWRSNIALALKQLNLKFDIKKFIFESGFDAGSRVMVLKRIYNKVNVDLFEGIERGNTIDVQFVYKDSLENSPPIEAVTKLLEIVGKFYGMSQWGTKFHCGRFSVVNVKKIIYE